MPLSEFEVAVGHKSVNGVYRQDRAVSRFEGRMLARKMEQLEKHYREWLGLNAPQLHPQQKAFKKSYAALAWHYRSRYESLISFSNAAFYSGNLFTIPDRQRALSNQTELLVTANEQGSANVDGLLARSISFHFMENGIYEDRRNPNEAAYIAQLVRGLLRRDTKLSIGLVAFSEAQQTEIEDALSRLADEDSTFAALLEAEYVREENDVFCGLFVKNLENVQGDERDIIIMSVCYTASAFSNRKARVGRVCQGKAVDELAREDPCSDKTLKLCIHSHP